MRMLLLALCLSLPHAAIAQTYTVTFTPGVPADRHEICVDTSCVPASPPAASIGPLAAGTYNLTVKAFDGTTTQTSAPWSLTVLATPGGGGGEPYSNLSPADGWTMRNGTPVTLHVTAPNMKSCREHWIWNGNDNGHACGKAGDEYTVTETPGSGPGVRTWWFTLCPIIGACVNTPTRSVVVTP